MKSEDYPALFSAADAAAEKARWKYFVVLRVQLGIFLTVSALGLSINVVSPQTGKVLWGITTGLLAIGVSLMWWSRSARLEKVWFNCRAVAESVKTATWRYMMQVPPFGPDDNAVTANTKLVEALGAIRAERPGVDRHLAGLAATENEITEFMRNARMLGLHGRKNLYISDRLRDQKRWYEDKAAENSSAAGWWVGSVIIIQLLALLVAITRTLYGGIPGALVSLLMTVATSSLAWTQARRHDDVADPYSLAASELRQLGTLAADVHDAATFEKLVTDAENAISREHTMWRARRGA